MNTIILIPIMIFAATFFFISGLYLYIKHVREHGKLIEKMGKGYLDSSAATVEISSVGKSGLDTTTGILRELAVKLTLQLGNLINPKTEEEVSQFQKPLARLGYRGTSATLIFFGIKVLGAILFPTLFLFGKYLAGAAMPPMFVTILPLAFALIGFYLPNFWLQIKIAARKEKIMEGFPDALDLMVICVEAGMGLDQAINRVGEEMKLSCTPISEEFKMLNMEMRMGKSRRDALKNMAKRTELDDVNSLVTLLIQTDQFGTSIAQALRVHSDYMRVQRRQRAEEKAAKLPVKILIPLIFFIFPALFVVIIGPAMIQIYHSIIQR